MRRYLVTGATGFVGSYLTRRLLQEGHEVHVFARRGSNPWRLEGLEGVQRHHADLLDPASLEEALTAIRPTDIWHLATYGGLPSQQDAAVIAQTNFVGTVNLLTAAEKVGFDCFLNTGSSSEYGIKPEPMREDDLPEPLTAYGASKAGATLYAQGLARTRQLPLFTLRLFSPYGPYEEPTRLVPTVIRGCLEGRAPRLASPASVRDFVYVEDVYRFYRAFSGSSADPGEIFNVGGGRQHTVGQLVETVIGLCDASLVPEWGNAPPRPHEPKVWQADISKAERLLGWRPTYSLEVGLQETIAWTRTSTIAARSEV